MNEGMQDKEIAWVAGIIEGEGAFWLSPRGFSKIQVSMSDRDVIERLQEWTGCGHVYGPSSKHKPVFTWAVTELDEFLFVAEKVQPWLLVRSYAELQPPLEMARARKAKRHGRKK